jgi:hypothetical protein
MPKDITMFLHRGLAKIFINYKLENKVNALENPSGYYPSFAPVSQSQKFKHMRQNNANGSSFKPFNNGSI